MYNPNFNYTDKIINTIAEIELARGMILNAEILPVLDITLKRNALIGSAHASTAIEGNPLTLNDVKKLLNGSNVTARKKAKKEVLNYLNVLKNIRKYQSNGKITPTKLLKMHKDITKDTLEHPSDEGRYRQLQNFVENRITGEIRYTPPPPEEVPKLVEDLLGWINNINELNPIIVAGIAHYELVRIHPFVDGNGRTARALATLILYLKDFDIEKYFALDEYYEDDKKAYSDALQTADNSLDLYKWLEYFLTGVLISVLKVKEEVKKITPTKSKLDSTDKKAVTAEQIKIIDYIQKNGKITNRETQKLLGVASQTAYYHIKRLLNQDIIKKEGVGRATHYVFKRV